ncbi:MAG: RluA family pseudouridine synthase [Planctomycetota bacterium]
MRLTVGPEGAGQRLDRWLAARFPDFSRALIMKYLKEGKGRHNGRRAKPGAFVAAGDELELPEWEETLRGIRGGEAAGIPDLPRARPRPEGILVLYEDEHMIAIDKPAGVVMHSGKGHAGEGIDLLLRGRFGRATRLVHRLDRDTSGVVVAARGHPDSARRLGEAFVSGDVEKTYFGLVAGLPDPARGAVDAPLVDTKELGSNVRVDARGKPARTEYAVARAFRGFSWLRLRPRTGRRHQIRAHLAHIGHPLAVDHVYGKRTRLRLRDLRPDLPFTWKNPILLARTPLHAAEITLRHPATGEEMTFRAPLAPDLSSILDLLEEGEAATGAC